MSASNVSYLTDAECKRLVNGCDPKKHPGFRELVQAALLTGCRYGELTALECADYNPDAGTLAIRVSKAGKVRYVTLPVEVIAEFDAWRRIRDPDGTEGWVRQNALIGRRTAMVLGATQALRRSNVNGSEAVANLEAGVIVNIQGCPAGPQCRVEVNGIVGWLNRDQIWGAYPNELVK